MLHMTSNVFILLADYTFAMQQSSCQLSENALAESAFDMRQ